MKAVVIYASHFGNTEKIARAIAVGLWTRGTVEVLAADEAPAVLRPGTDLVVIGGPTEQHGMTQSLAYYLDRLAPGVLQDAAVAAFDTRLRWPRWLSGSAAVGITQKARAAGARMVVPPESFFIKGLAGTGGRNTAQLDSGELDRATAWARALANQVADSLTRQAQQARQARQTLTVSG